jgi:hypothetical protein
VSAIPPEDPARKTVIHLARRLLAEAQACPELVRRSENSSTGTRSRTKAPPRESFPAMALLSDPALDVRQYLEDLVRIAVGSAQQAEDVLLEAREANRKARRSMAVVASLGALGLLVGIAGFTAGRSAHIGLSEVRGELSTDQNLRGDLDALQQQRKAEEAALSRQKTDQQAAQEALQHQIANLRQQASSLQDQVAQGLRDLEVVRTEAGKLRQNFETARTQTEKSRQDVDALQQQRNADEAPPASRQTHVLQVAVLPPRPVPLSPLKPASPRTQPVSLIMSGPSASQQLLTARQWLVTGRPDQARRVLIAVQTQMVFQPVNPDQLTAQGVNAPATDVGNAIRLLDMGAKGEAVQALNRAIDNAGVN